MIKIDGILKRQKADLSKGETTVSCKDGSLSLCVDNKAKDLLMLVYKTESVAAAIGLNKESADELTEFLKLYFDKG